MAVTPAIRVDVDREAVRRMLSAMVSAMVSPAAALLDVVTAAQRWREEADSVPMVNLTACDRDLLSAVDRYNECFARFAEPVTEQESDHAHH